MQALRWLRSCPRQAPYLYGRAKEPPSSQPMPIQAARTGEPRNQRVPRVLIRGRRALPGGVGIVRETWSTIIWPGANE